MGLPFKQRLPTPRSLRDLIQYFVFYDDEKGIRAVLELFDCAPLERAAITQMLLSRLPGPLPKGAVYNPQHFLKTLLGRDDTIDMMRQQVAQAYEEKRRRFFVHVPKCAGTHLTNTLRILGPVLQEKEFKQGIASAEEMWGSLRNFALGINYADTISFTGHERLQFYRQRNLIRAQDEVFTTVRNPVQLVYSFVSYVVMVCDRFRDESRLDVQIWLRGLGLTEVPEWPTEQDRTEFGRQVLRCPAVTAPDRMTFYLGDMTAQGAIDAAIETNIEITDTARYTGWSLRKFGVDERPPSNVSEPFFTRDHATRQDDAYVHDITRQDRVFYERIHQVLEKSGELSITGRMLEASAPKRRAKAAAPVG